MEAGHYYKYWCYYGRHKRHKPLFFHGAYVHGIKKINIVSKSHDMLKGGKCNGENKLSKEDGECGSHFKRGNQDRP